MIKVFTAEIREEVFNESSIFRGFGVQGEGPPSDIDFIFFFQSFNTPGNEIAPGSYIIGIYF